MNNSKCPAEAPQIIELDRSEFEHAYQLRRPFLLLSIRRPGSRFAQSKADSEMLSRCDVILHEWDQDQPPYPLPPVVIQARQALKVADWLNEHLEILAEGNCDFVIQSEEDSSQRSAFSSIVESTLKWSVMNRGSATPHAETSLMLEMAFAQVGIASALCSLRRSRVPVAPDAEVLQLISAIFAGLNVDVVICKWLRPYLDNDDEPAAAVVTEVGKSLGLELCNSREHEETRDFIAGVMRLRKTQCCTVPLDLQVVTNEHSAILHVGEIAVESLLAMQKQFSGSIQLLLPVEAPTLTLKSKLLHLSRGLLETQLGVVKLLSVVDARDSLSESLHSTLLVRRGSKPYV